VDFLGRRTNLMIEPLIADTALEYRPGIRGGDRSKDDLGPFFNFASFSMVVNGGEVWLRLGRHSSTTFR